MTNHTSDVTKRLATYIVESTFDDFPAQAVEIAKTSILDTVGVTLAGARDKTGATAISVTKSWGGAPVSVVIGGGFRSSAPNAAFANGTSAHALDFDDRSIPINHYNASLVPSVLALGESINATGRKVIESFILGYEVGARIGTGFGVDYYFRGGWHPANSWAPIGTAAACAKLLDLDVDQTRMALGIASSSSGGLRKHYGSNTKPLHCGYAARNGIIAAELAAQDFTADKDVLDQAPDVRETAHKYFSLPQVFCGTGNFDLDKMVEGLGAKYHLIDTPPEIKMHPGSISTSRFIDLTIEAMEKYSFTARDIAHVNCFVTAAYLDAASPFLKPTCPDESRYSLPYQVAVTLLDGNSWIDQHTEERMAKADVADMTARVFCEVVTVSNPDSFDMEAFKQMEVPKIAFTFIDGETVTVEPTASDDEIKLRLDPGEVERKYRDCAMRTISEADCEKSIELIDEFESLTNVNDYTKVLM